MNRNTAVVFDACVLYPAPLRDLLIELAGRAFRLQFFRAKWTEQIHEEWISNLLEKRKDLTRHKLEEARCLIDTNVPECLVTGYEHHVPSLKLKDKDDRHVLAAAIQCGATTIVTINLRDFPDEDLKSFAIVAKHPDDFICELLKEYEEAGEELFKVTVRAIKERLRNPKVSWTDYFSTLESNGLTRTVEKLKQLIPACEVMAEGMSRGAKVNNPPEKS